MKLLIKLFLISFFISPLMTSATPLDQAAVNNFIDHMVSDHQFDRSKLQSVFNQTNKSMRVLDAISKPAEVLPWYKYRSIFIQPARIDQGLVFWDKYQSTLSRAEEEYGVPAEFIIAIIGVETQYGINTGSDRVMDALSTLAFHYPKRGAFFRKELEQFLLLTRDQSVDPLSLKGSYAGAMGIPQFISSSYRNYAVDFDQDGKIDIWNNPVDAIGSVANYFKQHGWQPGDKVVVPGKATDNRHLDLLNGDLKPDIRVDRLTDFGIYHNDKVPADALVKVLSLEGDSGKEIWLGLNNFYVITRYNRSPLYAMAVYQLAESIQGIRTNMSVSGR